VRQFPIHLVGGDDPGVRVVVADRLVPQRRQRRELLRVPGDEDRAERFDRDPGGLRIGREQVVALANQAGLQRARDGVEPGVQDRRVGLAGALADVVAAVDDRHRQPVTGELAGDGRADDSGADHRDIEDRHAASAAALQRARKSAARPADHCGV
jgi:hypothetical protein